MKKSRGNLIDRAIGYISPTLQMKRIVQRSLIDLAASSYTGARQSRLNHNWSTYQESADASLYLDIQTLRDRSRDLNRNEPVAAGITETFTANAIHTGLKPQSRIPYNQIGISREAAKKFQKQAEIVWQRWLPWASSDRKMTFYGMQSLALRQVVESGESFALRRALRLANGRPYHLALNMIECDRVDDPPDAKNNKDLRFGIEVNGHGEAIRYHIRNVHPGDSYKGRHKDSNKFTAINAYDAAGRKNVFHIYPILRPGQTRGVPFFAPLIDRFKMLADYTEATLVAARVAACFSAFIKTSNGYGTAVARAATTENSQRLESIEPGMIDYLNDDEEITFSKPEHPTTTFDQFSERMLRTIGAAVGLPYELVLKDFSKTSYSSARASLLQAYRVFQVWQQLLINHFCQPVWELLMEEAWLRGELTAPSFEKYRWEYTRATWIPPGWQWVDPKKEADAHKIAKDNYFKTLSQIHAETSGGDWEESLEQAAIEQEKMAELGLKSPGATNDNSFNDDDDDDGGKA